MKHSAQAQNDVTPAVPLSGLYRSGRAEAVALNAESGAPDWVMLWPQGRLVVGRDKRSFVITDPEAIIAATRPRLPLLIDYEHDYEFRKPGDVTPAAGWIEELEVRDGAIWGRTNWAVRAANAIADREYRYLSPVYLYRPDTEPMQVAVLGGAGLTHRPNIGELPALNHIQESLMDPQIAAALQLPATATVADAVAAIAKGKADIATALNSATPSLEKYVPRADYDAVMTRAVNAEQTLADTARKSLEAAIATEIEAAVKAGKIAPAARDFYVATCSTQEGLEQFRKFVAVQPSVFGASGLDKVPAGGAGDAALTEQQLQIAANCGLSPEEYRKALNAA